MGDFDVHIAWLRDRKAIAEGDLEDYIAGATPIVGGMDFTASFVARTQSDIQEFEAPIAACQRTTADRARACAYLPTFESTALSTAGSSDSANGVARWWRSR